jgi:hypothetical protein
VGGLRGDRRLRPEHTQHAGARLPGDLYDQLRDLQLAGNKSGNLPNIPVDSILVNPNIRNQVFAGSDWGLYYTDDIDAADPVWQRFTNGLPTVMIWDMAIDRGWTTLALFTRSRGAYVWPLPSGPFQPPTPTPTVTGTPPGDPQPSARRRRRPPRRPRHADQHAGADQYADSNGDHCAVV